MLEAVPYHVHTILDDKSAKSSSQSSREPEHDHLPADALRHDSRPNGIEHRLTKPKPSVDQRPGREEEPHEQVRHRGKRSTTIATISCARTTRTSMAAYNVARRLKTPRAQHPTNTHLASPWDLRAGSIHPQSDPPDAGTEHVLSESGERTYSMTTRRMTSWLCGST